MLRRTTFSILIILALPTWALVEMTEGYHLLRGKVSIQHGKPYIVINPSTKSEYPIGLNLTAEQKKKFFYLTENLKIETCLHLTTKPKKNITPSGKVLKLRYLEPAEVYFEYQGFMNGCKKEEACENFGEHPKAHVLASSILRDHTKEAHCVVKKKK